MKLILTNHGSYPRIGDTAEHQLLRKTIAQWERKERSDAELREAEKSLTRAAIKEQADAGLDLVTDGLIRWYDPVSHVAGKLEGVRINGLLRFFDTNFYFRQPVIVGAVRRRAPLVVEDYQFAREETAKRVKPVLTGPYTLARLSIVEHEGYRSLAKLVEAMTAALAEEVRDLAAAGAEVIQLDEPSILKNPADMPLLANAIAAIAKERGKCQLAISTYFGDAAPLWDQLQALPVDIVGADFTYSPKLIDRIASNGGGKKIAFGLVDGRNTRLEREEDLVPSLERMLAKLTADSAYLTPSCGLEYLPRDRAFLKLQNMARLAARFRPS